MVFVLNLAYTQKVCYNTSMHKKSDNNVVDLQFDVGGTLIGVYNTLQKHVDNAVKSDILKKQNKKSIYTGRINNTNVTVDFSDADLKRFVFQSDVFTRSYLLQLSTGYISIAVTERSSLTMVTNPRFAFFDKTTKMKLRDLINELGENLIVPQKYYKNRLDYHYKKYRI